MDRGAWGATVHRVLIAPTVHRVPAHKNGMEGNGPRFRSLHFLGRKAVQEGGQARPVTVPC